MLASNLQYIYATLNYKPTLKNGGNNVLCKLSYKNSSHNLIFNGEYINYPYSGEKNLKQNTIQCVTPNILYKNKAKLSFSVNGADFFSNIDINLIPFIAAIRGNPLCFPINSIKKKISLLFVGLGYYSSYSTYYLSISGKCHDFPFKGKIGKDKKYSMEIPFSKNEGFGYLNVGYKENFLVKNDKSLNEYKLNNFRFRLEFYYFKQPEVNFILPHSSSYNQSQVISIFGSNFFKKINFGCTPLCYFGNIIVEANFINNNSFECKSPVVNQNMIGKKINLRFGFNGKDLIEKDIQFYFYK